MSRIHLDDFVINLIVFLICTVIYTVIAAISGDSIAIALLLCITVAAFIVIFVPFSSMLIRKKRGLFSDCKEYLEENKVKLGLFIRPALNKNNITLANKYCAINFNLSDIFTNWTITNKITLEKIQIKLKTSKYAILTGDTKYDLYKLFVEVIKDFDYETHAENLWNKVSGKNNVSHIRSGITKSKKQKMFLDINKISEAEFTAIPGVTIAKAKHAAKVRKQKGFYLSVNEFYKAINLDEQFIEQIPTKGCKIFINELPEYQRLSVEEK